MELTPERIINKRSHYGEDILYEVLGEKYKNYREKWNNASVRKLVTEFPLYLQFELSPYCNLQCCSCLHGHKDVREEYVKIDNILDMELYNKIIEEASKYNCPSISFHNNSEPLLDKELVKKIEKARDSGFVDIILVTNGTLLTKEKSIDIIKAGVTKITFSVDAFYDETYEKNRKNSDFNLLKKNIFDFLEAKKELNSKIPITRVSFVVNKNSVNEMKEFNEYWQDKVDLVDFQNFSAIEGYTEYLCPTGFEAIEDFQCNSPWQEVVIRANGDVLPCCSLYGSEVVLGNLKENSIYEIWNSDKMKKLREELAEGTYSHKACQTCIKTFYVSKDIQHNI